MYEDVVWFHIAIFASWGETKGFETQMSEIFRCAEEVAQSHIVARQFIFAYLFMLMIKFFKAFGILESSRYCTVQHSATLQVQNYDK